MDEDVDIKFILVNTACSQKTPPPPSIMV